MISATADLPGPAGQVGGAFYLPCKRPGVTIVRPGKQFCGRADANPPIEPLVDQYIDAAVDADDWLEPGIDDYPVIMVATPGLPDMQVANFAATQAIDDLVSIQFRTVIEGLDDEVTEISLTRKTATWLVKALKISISRCVDNDDV
jgi:hypothetical protein